MEQHSSGVSFTSMSPVSLFCEGMHDPMLTRVLSPEPSDASDDDDDNGRQYLKKDFDICHFNSVLLGQINSLLHDFYQRFQTIHANSAMDEIQKNQKFRELKFRLETLIKASEAAPPVQTKTPKVYKMCDCENSIRILQQKFLENLSRRAPKTSVKARYCQCNWAVNGCKKCTELGCGTDVCKDVRHYSAEFRDQHPEFWRRRSNCESCCPAYFCTHDDHYSPGYNFENGRRLKSACHECKVSRQSTAVASTN